MQTTPATALEDVYRTLQPTPLETRDELEAFYQHAINETRGGRQNEAATAAAGPGGARWHSLLKPASWGIVG